MVWLPISTKELHLVKPVVLIHGAWHGAWCFEDVIELLGEQGVDVHAADLPLRGTRGDIAATRDLIAAHPGCVVLGHSYGGLLITCAAVDLDASHLVYLAAMMPAEGEDVGARLAELPAAALPQALTIRDDGAAVIDPAKAIEAFYDDCEAGAARRAAARLRPQQLDEFPGVEEAAWRAVPSTYVVCRDDKALNPELQRQFAARASRVVEWDGAHSPFLAQPELVADLLAELAG